MKKRNTSLSRRQVLQGLGAGFGLAALGCNSTDLLGTRSSPLATGAQCTTAPTSWDSAREKISSVVLLCLENRSFDHYFGALSLPTSMGGLGMTDASGLTGNESNPSSFGGEVKVHKLLDFTPHDLPHDWDEMHLDFNNGAMDGFVKSAESWAKEKTEALQKNVTTKLPADELAAIMASEAMGFHTPDQIPLAYQLAEQAALCQSYFSSVMGPTWTNRFYLHGGTAEGLKDNISLQALGSVSPVVDLLGGWESILDVMEKSNGFEAANFFHDLCWLRLTNPDIGRELRRQFTRIVHKDDAKRPTGFLARARANALPPLSILDPHFGVLRGEDANDDHPDFGGADLHDVRKGQALIATVVKALAENRDQWNRTLLVITYDEAGGFFDHVPPPTTVDERDDFRQLGFRVPTIVVGPYVRPGCLVDTTLEHCSILKSIEQLFGATKVAGGFQFEKRFEDSNVTARIDASNDLLSCLDANALEGNPHPPPALDPVQIDLRKWKDLPKETYHQDMYAPAMRLSQEEQDAAREPILDEVMAIGEELGAVKLI